MYNNKCTERSRAEEVRDRYHQAYEARGIWTARATWIRSLLVSPLTHFRGCPHLLGGDVVGGVLVDCNVS